MSYQQYMNFWLRNIIIGCVLIALATYLLFNQDVLSILDTDTANDSSGKAELIAEPSAEKSIKQAPKKKKSKNAAAEGLSRFYASLNSDLDEKGLKIRNNIVFLPEPKGDLVELLEAKRLVTRPYRKSWKGAKKSHPFRKGETLFQKLSEYAEADNIEIIWWLNRDFLVKDPFRIEQNLLKTAVQVSHAVAGHFHHGISTFFCYNQRTIVIIENEHKKNFAAANYLNEECLIL